MKCPDCKGKRIKVLNPRWPRGSEPYCELCASCSGTGQEQK